MTLRNAREVTVSTPHSKARARWSISNLKIRRASLQCEAVYRVVSECQFCDSSNFHVRLLKSEHHPFFQIAYTSYACKTVRAAPATDLIRARIRIEEYPVPRGPYSKVT